MALTPQQQALELINKSKHSLVFAHTNSSGDAIGSALGLYLALKKLGKKTKIISPQKIPSKLRFLSQADSFRHKINPLRDFIISLDITESKIKRLHYQLQNDRLNIFLIPRKNPLKKESVSFSQGKFQHDLIITLDAPDLEHLGDIYEKNVEFFFETPIINIDHHPSNELFGEVNLVETTNSSTAEIVVDLIESLGEELIDEDIATSLLTGIILATSSFKTPTTTPQTFKKAAFLIAKGGNQQEIIRYLYKTKPLNSLRLWGRVMNRLHYDEEKKMIWSRILTEDFQITNTDSQHLSFVLEEIKENLPLIDLALLLWEEEKEKVAKVRGIIQCLRKDLIPKIAPKVGGRIKSDEIVFESTEYTLEETEEKILNLLNSLL